MNLFKKIFKKEKRSSAFSDMYQEKLGMPLYTDFSIRKSVKEGFKSNVWVFRSVFLIMSNAASLPWRVEKDGIAVDNHPLTELLGKPNPYLSRQQFFELFISWMELSGNAYIFKNKVGNTTKELWAISPDRIAPIPSPDVNKWLNGYAVDNKTAKKFEPEEIIHLMYARDPANPLRGISPLQAAGKIIDIDNDQKDFNKSAMQNQCILSGIWTFDREFTSQEETDAIAQKLNERYGGVNNSKRIGVLGSNAKYTRLSMTPQEMDFSGARKDNRNEIFIAFGIPPAFGGSEEAQKYNNYKISELIFWLSTVIPLLENIKDALNFSFQDELMPNETINFDISNISALREAFVDKVEAAKELFAMGVPFSQINKVFKFGFDEFEDWEKSFVGGEKEDIMPVRSIKKKTFDNIEYRSKVTKLIDEVDNKVEDSQKKILSILEAQQKDIFQDYDDNKGVNLIVLIDKYDKEMQDVLLNIYQDTIKTFTEKLILKRDLTDTVETQILSDLLKIVGIETGYIKETTINLIYQQIDDGLSKDWTMKEFQQAIIDTGVFSAERALRISRTVSTGACNHGQFVGAQYSGAQYKIWSSAGFGERKSHREMDNTTIPINDYFNVDGSRAMYPGDNSLPAKERINCRCVLEYSMEME